MKAYDVTGYAPRDQGRMLCPECHEADHNPDTCDCQPVFISEETDTTCTCDVCGEEIETTVIGKES